jgi:3-hydroxyacyl-[acyl-carrier-protein] dehydratase
MIEPAYILDKIPHMPPFRFIDEIMHIDSTNVEGIYTFSSELIFYNGHFPEYKITPGVILIETMAQIGLLPIGIYNHLVENVNAENVNNILPFLTGSKINFKTPVFPGEKVHVIGRKKYFRHGKLICEVKMLNSKNNITCFGTLEGVIFQRKHSGNEVIYKK